LRKIFEQDPFHFALGTAAFFELHWRTFDAPKRTKYTAITRRGTQQPVTPLALVEKDARIGGHFLVCGGATPGTGDDGAKRYFHGHSNDV
jgi:hypothetical protein